MIKTKIHINVENGGSETDRVYYCLAIGIGEMK